MSFQMLIVEPEVHGTLLVADILLFADPNKPRFWLLTCTNNSTPVYSGENLGSAKCTHGNLMNFGWGVDCSIALHFSELWPMPYSCDIVMARHHKIIPHTFVNL